QVAATATAQSYATAVARGKQDLYTQVTNKPPTLNDPLSNNGNGIWNLQGQCSFINGALHVYTLSAPGGSLCHSNNPIASKIYAFQVQMTIMKGDPSGLSGGFGILTGDNKYYSNGILIGLNG